MDTLIDSQYDAEIFQHLMNREHQLTPGPRLYSNSDIAASSRTWVLNWVINVHRQYVSCRNSIFLAANYLDRLLSVHEVCPGQLQLFAAVAAVIATKYDNSRSDTLSLRDVEAQMDYAYDIETLKHTERYILHMLRYELGCPTPLDFLQRTCRATAENPIDSTLAEGLAKATITDERFVHIPSSYVAASSLLVVRKMKGLEWTPEHVHCTTYSAEELNYTANLVSQCWVGKFGKGGRRR